MAIAAKDQKSKCARSIPLFSPLLSLSSFSAPSLPLFLFFSLFPSFSFPTYLFSPFTFSFPKSSSVEYCKFPSGVRVTALAIKAFLCISSSEIVASGDNFLSLPYKIIRNRQISEMYKIKLKWAEECELTENALDSCEMHDTWAVKCEGCMAKIRVKDMVSNRDWDGWTNKFSLITALLIATSAEQGVDIKCASKCV